VAEISPSSSVMPAADRDTQARRERRAAAILFGVAAHDIRTPLNAMVGWMQVLQSPQELPAATRERAFKGLRSAVAQQVAIADGLAQIGGIQADAPALDLDQVAVQELLAAGVAAVEEEARARSITVLLETPMSEIGLRSDAALVGAAIRHCLAGVVKFAAKNSVMNVAAGALSGPEPGCAIRVELEQSLLPAVALGAILDYVAGNFGPKPNGAGAAFAFSVAQSIALFLGGGLDVVAGEGETCAVFTLALPSSAGDA